MANTCNIGRKQGFFNPGYFPKVASEAENVFGKGRAI